MKLPSFRGEAPPVYFMHIPKTAGSSLWLLLTSAYPKQAVGALYLQHMHQYTPASIKHLRCISSHFGPGLLPWLPQPGLAWITCLRDPVEQFISHLYFRQVELNQRPHLFEPNYLAQMQPLCQADLRTLIETPIAMIPDNPQTRCLGAVEDVRSYFKHGAADRSISTLRGMPFACSATMKMSQIAALAHELLANMAVVGLTERFTESAELLCDLLGISTPVSLPTQNIGTQKRVITVHGYRQEIPADLLEQVQAKTTYDQELYGHACALFAEQLAQKRAKSHRTFSVAPRLRPMLQRAKGWHKHLLMV